MKLTLGFSGVSRCEAKLLVKSHIFFPPLVHLGFSEGTSEVSQVDSFHSSLIHKGFLFVRFYVSKGSKPAAPLVLLLFVRFYVSKGSKPAAPLVLLLQASSQKERGGDTVGSPVRSAPLFTTSTISMSGRLAPPKRVSQGAKRFEFRTSRTLRLHCCFGCFLLISVVCPCK